MNVQRWLKARRPHWERLEALIRIVETRHGGDLSRNEIQELGRLYRTASADLSRARAWKLGQDTLVYLNNLVVRAHNQVYQTPQNRWRDLVRFLWITFPKLVKKNALYIAASFSIFMVSSALSCAYVQKDVHFAQLEFSPGHALVPEDQWRIIEDHKMWTDEAEHYSPVASSLIATHNIHVAIIAFVAGITFGFGTVLILLINGISIGTVLGICKVYGLDDRLLAFVAPHGILELTAIFISGGAGLLMGRALLFPGNQKRLEALKSVSKDAVGLFGGCIPLLLIAGSIEGFISPRTDISASGKFLVSLATLVMLLIYLFAPRDLFKRNQTDESPLQ